MWTTREYLTGFIFMCLAVAISSSDVKLIDNKYDGTVIALSPYLYENKSTASSDIGNIINKIQVFLTRGSESLFEVTKKKTQLGKVTILIPKSWKPSSENWNFLPGVKVHSPEIELYQLADIFIEPKGGVFGDMPHTLQYRGCGIPGKYIQITKTYLSELESLTANHPKFKSGGQAFARQWAKYRYGVFDEIGYANDIIYPLYYGIPGKRESIYVTSCTNTNVSYKVQDSSGEECEPSVKLNNGRPNGNQCFHTPDEDNENVLSSFMYHYLLPNANNFCDNGDNPHNDKAPTKQNVLCFGKSTWEIIEQNSDFKETKDVGNAVTFPEIRYVQEEDMRIVIAIDWTDKMKEYNRFQAIKQAVNYFAQYQALPDTELGLVAYTYESKIWTGTLKKVPTSLSFHELGSNTPLACMSCTVKDSIKVLSSTGKPAAGGNIVMVTTGEMDNEGVDTMRELLKKEKVRLSLILYPVSKNANPNLVELAHDTKGRTFQINEKSSDEFSILTSLFELHQAFQDVIRGNSWEASDIPVTIASQCWAGSVQNMKFEFTVDKTVRKDLKVLLYGKDLSDPSKTPIILSSLKLIDPSETEIDSEELDNNMYFTVLGFIVEKAEAGLWKFSVDVRETSSYPFLLWVSAKETSETRAISVNVWLSTKDKKDVGGLPVVYVDVRSGVYPVSNAKVEAKVFNSRGDKESFQLFDSGLGDPDITRGDGIYSRYLTAISHKGWYSIIVYVDDNNGGAKVLKGLNSDQPCCGSFVPEDNAESAESFSRISHYGRLYILHDELDVSNPPSRITDLRVINLEELSKTVTLKWTAPGGDYDSGKGSYYIVKYFDNIYDARNQFEITGYDAKPNDILLTPEEYGTSQEANFLIDDSAWKDKEIYFGIVCVDDKDSKGEISNIVAVFLRSFLETTTVTEVTTTPNITTTYPNDKKKDDSNPNVPLILGLVFGFTGFGLFVLLIAFLYFRRRKWKAEHDKDYKNNQRRAEKDNNKNVHSNQKKDKDEIFQLPTSANYPEDSNHIQREINTNLNDVSVHPTIVQDVTPSAPSKNLSMWKHSSIYETATDSDSDVLTHRGKKGLNGRPDFQSSSSPLNSSLQSINEVCLPPKFPPSIVI